MKLVTVRRKHKNISLRDPYLFSVENSSTHGHDYFSLLIHGNWKFMFFFFHRIINTQFYLHKLTHIQGNHNVSPHDTSLDLSSAYPHLNLDINKKGSSTFQRNRSQSGAVFKETTHHL